MRRDLDIPSVQTSRRAGKLLRQWSRMSVEGEKTHKKTRIIECAAQHRAITAIWYKPYMKPVRPGNEKRRALPVAALDEKTGDPAVVPVEHLAGAKQSHVACIAAQNEPVLRRDPFDQLDVADSLPAGGDVVLRAA